MKKQLLIILCLCIGIELQAQVSKTVNVTTAGTIYTQLPYPQDTSITNLTVTGTIDSLDFIYIASLPALTVLDLSGAICKHIPVLAFVFNDKLLTVSLPLTLTSIGDSAFYSCYFMKSITIPSTVTSIGCSAFYDCGNISSITIPPLVTTIREHTFDNCFALTTISIPSSVTSIGNDAFYVCSKLTSITIPPFLTSIGDEAFDDCTALTSIIIPSTVTSIGKYAFSGCSLSSIIIPNSVTYIGEGVFFGCDSLTSITIPNSLTSIENYVFAYCSSLSSITIPASVTSIGEGAFCGCSALPTITIPSSVTSIKFGTFAYCSLFSSFTIPSTISSIENFAFAECNNLTTLSIPSSVTAIGDSAFRGCSNLQSIFAHSIIPVQLTNAPNVFNFVDTSKCYLYVPAGSLAAYQGAYKWKSFKHIIAMETLNSNSTINVYPQANTMSIFVQTSGSWTATSTVPWLSFSFALGTGNDSIKIIVAANPTNAPRSGIIVVSSDASVSLKSTYTQTITVTQAAGETNGFATLQNDDFTLFPNPATSSFSIDNEGLAKVILYNINGKEVLNTSVNSKEPIPISMLSTGLYFPRIITATQVVTKRLVVQ